MYILSPPRKSTVPFEAIGIPSIERITSFAFSTRAASETAITRETRIPIYNEKLSKIMSVFYVPHLASIYKLFGENHFPKVATEFQTVGILCTYKNYL